MATHKVRIWDWPVRLTHWGFALLVPAMYLTAENSLWGWHTRLGHVLLALLAFRVIWGFVGTRTARFADFVKGPARVIDYLRGRYDADRHIGHSPLAALSVLALLGAMAAQVAMGLFAGDPYDGATGPLNPLVGVATADRLTDWHETFVYVVLGLAALHISAIAYYAAVKRRNLVTPMVTGTGEKADSVDGIARPGLTAFVALAVAVGVAVWVWLGAPPLE